MFETLLFDMCYTTHFYTHTHTQTHTHSHTRTHTHPQTYNHNHTPVSSARATSSPLPSFHLTNRLTPEEESVCSYRTSVYDSFTHITWLIHFFISFDESPATKINTNTSCLRTIHHLTMRACAHVHIHIYVYTHKYIYIYDLWQFSKVSLTVILQVKIVSKPAFENCTLTQTLPNLCNCVVLYISTPVSTAQQIWRDSHMI